MTTTTLAVAALALGALSAAEAWRAGAPAPAVRGSALARRRAALRPAPRMDEGAEWVGAQQHSEASKDTDTVFGIERIMEILPHRYPFLLVDKVIEFEPGKRCVGVKKVTMNEQFFTGHFPNRPIMPGVLQVEAMAQVGGLVALQEPVSDAGGGKGDFFFAGVDNIRWRRPVVPGDTLVMEMELVSFKARFGIVKMKGKAFVDGKPAVDGDFTFALVKE